MQDEDVKVVIPAPKLPLREDHPWLEMPLEEDSLDETVRYSLDEIRYA